MSLARILHELSPAASIVIASHPKAAWRSRLLDCFVATRNDGHAYTLYLPLSPQGTVCPLKYSALTGFPALFHALKHRFAFVTHAIRVRGIDPFGIKMTVP